MDLETMDLQDARNLVACGAAHLDKVRPGWAADIDIGTLTLHDPCGCVVGQLCRISKSSAFSDGLMALGVDSAESFGFERPSFIWPLDMSPTQFHVEARRRYALLQEAWIEAIADRLMPSTSVNTVAAPVEEPVSAQFAQRNLS